ncbi:MAG: hypothetical protein KAR11_01630 [Phycisphaerae bacterium]|nr:hypothetical protein [Phycisphaerae bacterium]
METKTVELEKNGHFFVIQYALGLEDEVVEHLMMMADDRESAFDWMDAAAMSFDITEAAANNCIDTMQSDEF